MKSDRNRKLARVHIAKKELGLDDDDYRAALRSLFGKESAKHLSDAELDALIAHFVDHGWDGQGRRRRRRAQDPQSRKIRALWLRLHDAGAVRDPSEQALGAFARRMTGKQSLWWLAPDEKSKLIEELKQWLARVTEGGEGPPSA